MNRVLYFFILIPLCFLTFLDMDAGVPQLMNYQGYLTDNSGDAINGVKTLEFLIYNTETGGTSLWSEKQNVIVSNGLFNVLLGSVNLISETIFKHPALYFTLKIDGGEEMERKQFATVAFAFRSENTNQFAGKEVTEFVRTITGIEPHNGNINITAGSNITVDRDEENHQLTISASGGSAGFELPYTGSYTGTQASFRMKNAGTGYAIDCTSEGYHAIRASSGAEDGYGIYSFSDGTRGRGVYGSSDGEMGYGIFGSSENYRGVYGTSVNGVGVAGKNSANDNYGYLGGEVGAYGYGYGAEGYLGRKMGQSMAYTEIGVYGRAKDGNYGFLGSRDWAVYGEHIGSRNWGYIGHTDVAVFGANVNFNSFGWIGSMAEGVRGESTNGTGVFGRGGDTGVYGRSANGIGVVGHTDEGTAVQADGDLEVIGAYKGQIGSSSHTDGAPYPRPAYDSGWHRIDPNKLTTYQHSIGGNRDDYFVELTAKEDGVRGIHNRGHGGAKTKSDGMIGVYYQELDEKYIKVYRLENDSMCDYIRIRIWVIK